jgi:predicted hotdog family 3-hydroxylacyl-ACP dehydratase
MTTDLTLPMPVEALIPHEPPLRLIDRLLEVKDGYAITETFVRPENVLIDEDRSLDPVAMIELMAQSYAALKGYDDLINGRPKKKGFLVGIAEFRMIGRAIGGQRLRIRVERTGSTGGFALADGEVRHRGKMVAAGTIKIWVPE